MKLHGVICGSVAAPLLDPVHPPPPCTSFRHSQHTNQKYSFIVIIDVINITIIHVQQHTKRGMFQTGVSGNIQYHLKSCRICWNELALVVVIAIAL